MADLTIGSVIDGFLDETTAAGARQAIGIYLTQPSSATLTQVGAYGVTITASGTSNITIPTSGTLVSSSNKLSSFASTTPAELRTVISAYTGTGDLVFADAPTFTAPVLGVATATSVNKVAITAPATSATLTIANGATLALAGAFSTTFTSTGATTVTLPTTGTLYGTATGSITSLQLKTSLSDETGSGSAVFATSPTLVTPVLGVATCTSINGLSIVTSTGSIEVAASAVAFYGNDEIGISTTADTNITLPTTGTLATLAGSETLSNKTLTAPIIGAATGTSLAVSGTITSSGGAIGYAAGAGGVVTQATNRSTGVTIDELSGTITTNTTSLAAETAATFIVTNSTVAIGDVPVVAIQSGSNGGNTSVFVSTVAAGSFSIRVANNNAAGGTAETGAILINFAIIRAVTT